MAAIPVESAGFTDAAALGPFMWVVYIVLMISIGISAGTIVSLLLLAPGKVRSWAREGLRRTYCG